MIGMETQASRGSERPGDAATALVGSMAALGRVEIEQIRIPRPCRHLGILGDLALVGLNQSATDDEPHDLIGDTHELTSRDGHLRVTEIGIEVKEGV